MCLILVALITFTNSAWAHYSFNQLPTPEAWNKWARGESDSHRRSDLKLLGIDGELTRLIIRDLEQTALQHIYRSSPEFSVPGETLTYDQAYTQLKLFGLGAWLELVVDETTLIRKVSGFRDGHNTGCDLAMYLLWRKGTDTLAVVNTVYCWP